MSNENKPVYLSQLKAMLKRNILLKKREKRRTITELLLPIYFLSILIVIKLAVPDPNIPELNKPRGEENIFTYFCKSESHTIAVAPDNPEIQNFLKEVDKTLSTKCATKLNWNTYKTEKDVNDAYDTNPNSFPLAVVFTNPIPLNDTLTYQIRTNPSFMATPSTTLISTPIGYCIGTENSDSLLEKGDVCPINKYYFSGFLALQTLIDYTRIKLDTGFTVLPEIALEIMPKAAQVGSWAVTFRVIVPLYMVLALSQFITYLMILIVGEKEKKIKEGMKIMGLIDSVFWLSWFVIYAFFVVLIAVVCILLLYFLKVFTNSNFFLIFILIVLYGFSVIMFAFMITPFFDRSKTAGIVSSFILVIMSLFYYLQVFIASSYPGLTTVLSLISPAGFAMAVDQIVTLDMAGVGVTFGNMWTTYNSGIPIGGSLLMLLLDIVLYGAIAFYLDSVIPSEHGVKRSPFFCFMPSFWRSKAAQVVSVQVNSENFVDIEPIRNDLKGKEAIRIVDLCKTFKQFRKAAVSALDGVNLTIYEGQITAILGHNGAGKTTLFNILTGLTAPTVGSAYVFGYDVRNPNDMDKIRRMTGVCPQHDILFEHLTPREHLEFFAALKGIQDVKSAVDKTIRDIDLVDKMNTASKNLSGGQKRKLSVGIAIIGNPKIIILDEPTAGIDPYSRRHMWNVLQNVRQGKVILLTTHFMDEADILADRKAVVSKGKVRCCGSSLFLKNKFGIGYHLTLVLEENSNEDGIKEFITKYVRMAQKDRRHGKELSFILPYNAVEHFSVLFTAIENEIHFKSALGISSYGVSMTTLEEVFLRLQKEEEEGEEVTSSTGRPFLRSLSNPSSEHSGYAPLQDSTAALNNVRRDVADGLRALELIKCTPSTSQMLPALIKLRLLRLWREKQKAWSVIFMPIFFAALGLYLNTTTSYVPSPSNPLSLSLFLYNGDIGIHNGTSASLETFVKQLTRYGRSLNDYNGNFSSLLETAPRLSAFDVIQFSDTENSINVLYNDTQLHSLPVLVNLLSNVFYGLSDKSPFNFNQIQISTYPFESKSGDGPLQINGGNFVLGMIFLFSPIILAVDMVYDREIKARNQLRVNGLSFWLYFISFFVVQVALLAFITGTLLLLIVAFKTESLSNGPALLTLAILVILYCPASVLFTTCISYFFDKTESAQSIMPNVSILLGFLPYLPVMFAKQSIAKALHYIFSFLDVMYIPYGMLHYTQKVYSDCEADSNCVEPSQSDYLTSEIIVLFIALIFHIPFWFFMLLIIDVKKSGGHIMDIFKSKKSNNNLIEDANETRDIGVHEDQDVKHERERVQTLIRNPNDNPPVVVVENLHKVYSKDVKTQLCSRKSESKGNIKVAVKSLSLAVDAGEVFGLLGHNGAGKTTAMKIITAEESPTRGRVQIAGKSILSNVNSVFQLLGYCPQHDAQWKTITVKEHLELYATIRGVPKKNIKKTVNMYIKGLEIQEHQDKQTDKCSGGTKRKLSYAMAMVGNPRIVLLDEPSTGMDPQSKRFLWDTVLASFKGSKGAILTTHSMEEADALCSRVGIMVNGELRCLGSTQHLKNLYGAGYKLEIKLLVEDINESNQKVTNMKQFVSSLFPQAVLEESFADRLMFSVPQQSVTSLANCFKSLEEAKSRLSIEEYSFSQTTLEQVFLKFAYEGEHEDD